MAGGFFSINHAIVSGNLTRDPELRSLPSGMAVCELGIAYNERVKDRESGDYNDRANFFDVTAWGSLGEQIARQMSKGDQIVISGRLRFESWEKDGEKRSKVKIVAESFVNASRSGNGGSGGGGSSSRDEPPADDFQVGGGASSVAPDDDIPF